MKSFNFGTILFFLITISLTGHADVSYDQRRNLITSSPNGTFGFCHKGLTQVVPQYDEIILLGSNRPCFMGRIGDKWTLLDIWNRPLISKQFLDIQTSPETKPASSLLLTRDSIFIANRGIVLPPLSFSCNNRSFQFTNATPAVLVVKQINPQTNKECWTFVTFDGNQLTTEYYDYASVFRPVSDKKHRNQIYLANVKRNNLWGAIDLNGKEVIPTKYKSPITNKNKDLQKLLKKDYSKNDKIRIKELEALVPEEGINTILWMEDSVPNVSVEKIGGKLISAKKTKNRSKKQKQAKPQYTPIYYRLLINDTIAINEDLEEVDKGQNPMIRVKKDGKWGLYKIGEGMIYPCEFLSFEPFNQFGISKAILFDSTEMKISAYGAYTSIGPDVEEIYQRYLNTPDKKNFEITGPILEELLDALEVYNDPFLRLHCQPKEMTDYFNMRREREDPAYAQYLADLRERERLEQERIRQEKEQERQKKKSDGGFWGLLGDLASLAGEVIETTGSITGKSTTSATGSSLSSLGKSVSAVARGTEMPTETSNHNTVTSRSNTTESTEQTNNKNQIEQQIKVLDSRIKQNREQAAELLKKRVDSKTDLKRDLYSNSSRTKQSNLTKNNAYTNTRNRANTAASATVGKRNAISSIDTQLNRLDTEWRNLVQQRAALSQQIDDDSDYETSSSSKSKTKEDYQRDYDMYADIAKNYYNALKSRGSSSTTKNGKDSETSSTLSNSSSMLKRELVRSQVKMKHIRQNALAKKFTLTKSEYETVKVTWESVEGIPRN